MDLVHNMFKFRYISYSYIFVTTWRLFISADAVSAAVTDVLEETSVPAKHVGISTNIESDENISKYLLVFAMEDKITCFILV